MAGASPSQQQQQLPQAQTSAPSSLPSSSSVSGPPSVQQATVSGSSGVASSEGQGQGQQQTAATASGGSGGPSGQIGNPPTPHPAREMVSNVHIALKWFSPFSV